ncbi:meiosis induction protein kinase IME2/SME1-like [Arachis ipaensis]|uniref:meiosis induction protein kinase IME2/SME1-like n=1 Tax=Arachis ipaensis TaxID=130454 RepID=UPI000A2B910E|nr:meiosis induction protein kinase IME2/SME1-like [Arachis ipaensis]XP_025665215.1 mitogen-activated protein kinase kinase kinase 17-like [Arachis hypogaea]
MIVKGLSHIHRKGIVHCDLKPENILVFPSLDKEIANYQLKIADFGLSKTKEEEADVELWKSKPRGTLSYLSLEAFFGHIDAPMDIWAPGCIVIKILTGFLAWGESVLHEDYLTYLVEHFGESPKKPQGIALFIVSPVQGPDGYAVGFLGQAVFFSMMALPKRSWSRAMELPEEGADATAGRRRRCNCRKKAQTGHSD